MQKLIAHLLVISYLFFSNSAFSQGYATTGDAAALTPDTFLLTPDLPWQTGAVWYKLKHNFTLPFSIQGSMFFGDSDDGADGIVFVLQNECLLEGTPGQGIGYELMPGESLGIEFDTYQNVGGSYNDPSYDHIGIHRDGSVDHLTNLAGPVQMDLIQPNVEDNNWHDFQIDYDPTTTTISVYFEGSLRLSYVIDITNTIFGGDPYAYWGFTSATGGSTADNQVAIANVTAFTIKDTTICQGGTTEITLPPLSASNVALEQSISASSEEGPFTATLATDGNLTTRWSSLFSDPEWITVDLGTPRDIDSVHLYWEGAYGIEYIIQTSTDNITWTDQYHEFAGNGGLDQVYFTATGVQYVRMLGLQRATPFGYSLWEFEVFTTPQYAWSPNDGSIDDTSSNTPTFSPTTTTVYTLTISDVCFGSTDFNYTVVVDCNILPVELIAFTVENENRYVKLAWQTASEIDNDYFVIERSTDNENWGSIGKVDGAGTTNELLNYTLIDTNIDWGLNGYYYRLKQVDFNGVFKSSEVRFVPLSLSDSELMIYPSPTNDFINIVGSKVGSSEVSLYDIRGSILPIGSIITKNKNNITLSLGHLESGVYVIRVGSQSRFVRIE